MAKEEKKEDSGIDFSKPEEVKKFYEEKAKKAKK